MKLVLGFVFEDKIDHQFDHENLHDFIGNSIPVTNSLITAAMLLLQICREFLKPKVNIQGRFDTCSVDIHHHVLQHERLLQQIFVFNLSLQQLLLLLQIQHQKLLRVILFEQLINLIIDYCLSLRSLDHVYDAQLLRMQLLDHLVEQGPSAVPAMIDANQIVIE